MCKSEIFAAILNIISEETELEKELILSDSKEVEIVDARYLFVHFLSLNGFYPSQIAARLMKTKRAINYMLSNFDARLETGKMIRINYDNIKNRLGSR